MFEIITDIARAINVYGYKSLAFAVSFVRVIDIYLSVNNVYTMQLQTINLCWEVKEVRYGLEPCNW